MSTLELLEAGRGGPFRFRVDGVVYLAHDPADLDFQLVLGALQAECMPEGPCVETWKVRQLGRAWAAHYDLPDFASAQRLAYLLDRYRSALVYDLASFCNADLSELWLTRRWRTLLDLIDHLPGWSWYSTAVAGDDEHTDMLVESMKARSAEGDKSNDGPPQNTWTPEVAAITALNDSVNHLVYVSAAAAGGKPQQPTPLPRPSSPLEAAMKRNAHATRMEKHKSLVARMLPHKAESTH